MSRSWASWILTDNADFITGSGHLTTLLTTLCAFIGDGRHILPEGQHIVRLLFGNRGDRCQMYIQTATRSLLGYVLSSGADLQTFRDYWKQPQAVRIYRRSGILTR